MHLYNLLLALQGWQLDPNVRERLFVLAIALLVLLGLTIALSVVYTPAGKYRTVTCKVPFLPRSPYRFVLDTEQGLRARLIRQGWDLVFLLNTPLYELGGPFDPIEIPVGSFGVLIANEGKPLPPGRQASAKQFSYDDFLDGQNFLDNGGERGPQAFILGPGPHFLHQGLFTHETIQPQKIPTGYVGVLVCKVGDDPDPDEITPIGNPNKGSRPVYILKPRDQRRQGGLLRGIEAEVLLPGDHVINPHVHDLHLVDTTPTRLRVNGTDDTFIAGAQTRLDAISVITSDGFRFALQAEVVIQVLPEQAPAVVALGGSYAGFVHEVVVPYLDHIMKAAIAQIELKYFIQHLDAEREIIEVMLRAALEGRDDALAALSDTQKANAKLTEALDKGAQVDQRENYPIKVNTFRFLAQEFAEASPGVRELLRQLEAVSIAKEEALARVEQLKVAEGDTKIANQRALAQAAEIVAEASLRAEASPHDLKVINDRLAAFAPLLQQAGSLGQIPQGILMLLVGSQLNPDLMAMLQAATDELIRRPDQPPEQTGEREKRGRHRSAGQPPVQLPPLAPTP